MKQLMVAFGAFFMIAAAHAQTAPVTSPAAAQPAAQDISKILEVSDVDHDMGKIPYGKPIEYEVSKKYQQRFC